MSGFFACFEFTLSSCETKTAWFPPAIDSKKIQPTSVWQCVATSLTKNYGQKQFFSINNSILFLCVYTYIHHRRARDGRGDRRKAQPSGTLFASSALIFHRQFLHNRLRRLQFLDRNCSILLDRLTTDGRFLEGTVLDLCIGCLDVVLIGLDGISAEIITHTRF